MSAGRRWTAMVALLGGALRGGGGGARPGRRDARGHRGQPHVPVARDRPVRARAAPSHGRADRRARPGGRGHGHAAVREPERPARGGRLRLPAPPRRGRLRHAGPHRRPRHPQRDPGARGGQADLRSGARRRASARRSWSRSGPTSSPPPWPTSCPGTGSRSRSATWRPCPGTTGASASPSPWWWAPATSRARWPPAMRVRAARWTPTPSPTPRGSRRRCGIPTRAPVTTSRCPCGWRRARPCPG